MRYRRVRLTVFLGALLLLVGGGWLFQRSSQRAVEPVPITSVELRIPLTVIRLDAGRPIQSADEAEAVIRWWHMQPVELLDRLQARLYTDVPTEAQTIFQAYARADGGQVVFITRAQETLARCDFDSTGRLTRLENASDSNGGLSVAVMASDGQDLRRTSPGEAHLLAIWLARLIDPMADHGIGEEAITGSGEWSLKGERWIKSVKTADPDGNSGRFWTIYLGLDGVPEAIMQGEWGSVPALIYKQPSRTPQSSLRPHGPKNPQPIVP